MLKCLRFLKPALMCLHAAKEITCDMLDNDQWVVLEQIEITLKKIAQLEKKFLQPTRSECICSTYTFGYDSCVECKGEPRRN
jgi:hypothetical protein